MLGTLVADRAEAQTEASTVGGIDEVRASAFRRLVDGELDHAYRLAAVILGSTEEAEDAVHDAALIAWRRWSDLRDASRFEAWFGRILINTCRDRLRRHRRRAVFELDRNPTPAEHPATPDSETSIAERDRLRRALERLTADERIAVVLRYDADLTVPAIASRLAVPEGTVKSRLHHALSKLRPAIDEADR